MDNIIVRQNQTLLDIINMACGTMEAAMAMAKTNNLSVSDAITVGQILSIPDNTISDQFVLTQLQENKIVMGTKD